MREKFYTIHRLKKSRISTFPYSNLNVLIINERNHEQNPIHSWVTNVLSHRHETIAPHNLSLSLSLSLSVSLCLSLCYWLELRVYYCVYTYCFFFKYQANSYFSACSYRWFRLPVYRIFVTGRRTKHNAPPVHSFQVSFRRNTLTLIRPHICTDRYYTSLFFYCVLFNTVQIHFQSRKVAMAHAKSHGLMYVNG